jgi:hypothetical protein
MMSIWRLARLGVVLALGIGAAVAQPVTSAKSGVVSYLEGKVYLGDERLEFSTVHFPQIKEGGTLRTEDGRAEVLLTPGMILRLGENSSLKMLTNRLIDTRLELLTGSAVVEADNVEKDTSVTVVCKSGTVGLSRLGIYRFDAEPGRLKVFKGLADVRLGSETAESIEVPGGKTISLGGDTATAEKFNIEDTDSLDRWSGRRAGMVAAANPSAARQTASTRPWFTVGMGLGMGYQTCGWIWNPWFGMYTYVPCNGTMNSPYGYRYWSPGTVGEVYYHPTVYSGPTNSGYSSVPYSSSAASTMNSSAVVNSTSSVSTASSSSMGSTSSAAAASSSAGHGSASGGGGHH